MSVTSEVCRELPSLNTLNGSLVDSGKYTAEELIGGFIFNETRDMDHSDPHLHVLHVIAASLFLQVSGIIPATRTIPEYQDHYFSNSTVRHLDGILYRYYQAHSTQPGTSLTADYSRCFLERYDLDAEEHRGIQLIASQLNYPSANKSIGFHLQDPMNGAFNIPVDIVERDPDTTSISVTGASQTLFFPNGYCASPQDKPSSLFVHSFQSAADETGSLDERVRITNISRIEPLFVYDVT